MEVSKDEIELSDRLTLYKMSYTTRPQDYIVISATKESNPSEGVFVLKKSNINKLLPYLQNYVDKGEFV